MGLSIRMPSESHSETRGTMSEPTRCCGCGGIVYRHGVIRCVEWDGLTRVFCSDLCEFLWRRKNRPEDEEIFGPTSGPVTK